MLFAQVQNHINSLENSLLAMTKLCSLCVDDELAKDRKELEMWHLFFEVHIEALAKNMPCQTSILLPKSVVDAVRNTQRFLYEHQEARIASVAKAALHKATFKNMKTN